MGIVAILLALLSSTHPLWSFTVAGTVVDEKGKPIAGARVEMVRLESGMEDAVHEAETDGEGRFRIPDLPLARFELTAGSPEHVPFVKKGITAPPGTRTLDVGRLILKKRALISGRVVDRQGRPVQGVEVWPLSQDRSRPSKAAAVTDSEGRFELRQRALRDDEDLRICRPGYVSQWIINDEISSEPLRIVIDPAVRVSGRVVDSEGEPVEGAIFTATFSGEFLSIDGPGTSPCPSGKVKGTGPDGGFTLELEKAGWYQLQAKASGYLSATLEKLHVPAEGLEIRLGKGAVVSGRVTDPKGAPIAGAQIYLSGGVENGAAVSDADGRFTIKGVEPGEWEIMARHPDYAQGEKNLQVPPDGKRLALVLQPRSRLEIRGRVVGPDGAPIAGALVADLERQTVTAADGSFVLTVDRYGEDLLQARKEGFGPDSVILYPDQPPPDPLELRLPRGVTLTGRLVGVEPGELSWAEVSLSNPSYPGSYEALVDSDGAFHAFDLPPGRWRLSASAGGRFATVDVEIPPDSPGVTQDVQFAPTHEVRGRVTGPDGEPVPGAGVALVLANSGVTEIQAQEDGSFSVFVEDGVYTATAVADGFARTEAGRPVVVNGGPVDGVEIRLRPGVVLTGRFPGLEPGEVPGLNIDGPERRSNFAISGEADQEGGYRLTNLGPGEWTVRAVLRTPGTGSLERIAVGSVTIPEGAREARLDLDFHLGDLTLTVRFEEPVDYATLYLRLPDGSSLMTAYYSPRDGRIRAPRLRAGSYHLQILGDGGIVLLDELVALTVDQEIVVSPPD